ncbi:hypothetical protein HRI_004555900 [Hibiscus trionum]|uniref:F-box domain-containing protein n=1 Tax=Hibiscus trionum TaxID=183268 RepID=A0A9W7J918_HIBTR|nr:hypothetical protein HRI_004555900 [Hibiscus trionum]
MVFRDSLEPKLKSEGAEHDSPIMVGLQGQVSMQPPASFKHNLRVSQHDWHLLTYILLANKTNTKCVGQDFLDQDVPTLTFGHIGLNGKKPIIVARSGKSRVEKASDDSLLPDLNDDMALNVLAWSSRSDYPNLSCLNRKFRSLISSGYLYKFRSELGIREHWVYLACNMMPWKLMVAVAALCVQYEANFRPNMSIVVKALAMEVDAFNLGGMSCSGGL